MAVGEEEVLHNTGAQVGEDQVLQQYTTSSTNINVSAGAAAVEEEEEAFASMQPSQEVMESPLSTALPRCFEWRQVSSKLRSAAAFNNIDSASGCSGLQDDVVVQGITSAAASGPHADQLSNANHDRKWYMVVFRSKRRQGADSALLYAADAHAHEEAKHSGGLLMYWYGLLNNQRECFATCIWKSREDAIKASRLPKHRIAATLASEMYDFYHLEKYWLTFSKDGDPIFEDVINGISPHS